MLFWFNFFIYVLVIGLYFLIIGVKVFKHKTKTIVRNEETLFSFCYCLIASIPYTLVLILTDKFNLSLSLEIFFRILLSIPIVFLFFSSIVKNTINMVFSFLNTFLFLIQLLMMLKK